VHKIWQDAENELSLLEDLLDTPADGVRHFVEHWLVLRSHVLWLASLDPDSDWAKLTHSYSDSIETELTRETFSATMKPSFEAFCRVLKFRFFAIDATLKADCGALSKFHIPLKTMVKEISDA
jgi:hypothetical protein